MEIITGIFKVLGELTHLARTLFTDGMHFMLSLPITQSGASIQKLARAMGRLVKKVSRKIGYDADRKRRIVGLVAGVRH